MANLMLNSFRKMIKNEEGTEVAEYAIVIGLIVVAAIAIIAQFGTRVLARWNSVNQQLDGTSAVRAPAPIR